MEMIVGGSGMTDPGAVPVISTSAVLGQSGIIRKTGRGSDARETRSIDLIAGQGDLEVRAPLCPTRRAQTQEACSCGRNKSCMSLTPLVPIFDWKV